MLNISLDISLKMLSHRTSHVEKYLQRMRHRTPHVESFVADVETSHISCWAFNCRCWSIIHLLIYLWLWMLMYNSCHVDSLVVYAETSHIVFWILSCIFWSITHLGMIFRRNACVQVIFTTAHVIEQCASYVFFDVVWNQIVCRMYGYVAAQVTLPNWLCRCINIGQENNYISSTLSNVILPS